MGELISVTPGEDTVIKFSDVEKIKTPTARGVITEYRVRIDLPVASPKEIKSLIAGYKRTWNEDQFPYLHFGSSYLKIANIEAVEDSPTPMMAVTVTLSGADYRAIFASKN